MPRKGFHTEPAGRATGAAGLGVAAAEAGRPTRLQEVRRPSQLLRQLSG